MQFLFRRSTDGIPFARIQARPRRSAAPAPPVGAVSSGQPGPISPPSSGPVAECYSRRMKTMPTRIDGELFAAAKAAGEVHSRSAAQQLDHWARIGRQLEASPAITHDAIERVLAGTLPCDAVAEPEQALVRTAWDEQIAARISELDFAEEFAASGSGWVEADADGNVVERQPPAPTA